ncbi:unnamed protein product [Peronospora belbahrii]|uniref:Integrase catalytic domain-containing protein n=1 Tax=Peronospora belbahrii TaxID=622444 RepID=A0AAU9L5Z2_9STRA|nr:unnamed protein product [Peronospora belbahrii]
MDFVFGLPRDAAGNTGIVVFVDRLSKMAHLAAVLESIDGEGIAKLFMYRVFRQHGLPVAIVLDIDPVGRTDQTERVNCVIGDMLCIVFAETRKQWSTMLTLVEFALITRCMPRQASPHSM